MSESTPTPSLPHETEATYDELLTEVTSPEDVKALQDMHAADQAERQATLQADVSAQAPDLTLGPDGVVGVGEQERTAIQENTERGSGGGQR